MRFLRAKEWISLPELPLIYGQNNGFSEYYKNCKDSVRESLNASIHVRVLRMVGIRQLSSYREH